MLIHFEGEKIYGQNSSRTFGEILSADMRGKKVMSLPEAQDTWWFKALQKIKENYKWPIWPKYFCIKTCPNDLIMIM